MFGPSAAPCGSVAPGSVTDPAPFKPLLVIGVVGIVVKLGVCTRARYTCWYRWLQAMVLSVVSVLFSDFAIVVVIVVVGGGVRCLGWGRHVQEPRANQGSCAAKRLASVLV